VEVIKVQDLSKIYIKGKVNIPALSDVNFCVFDSEFISIVGKSGSGKSTLLNILGGLASPTHGKVLFNGKDIYEKSRYESALHRRHTVGMIFQNFNLISSKNALENVELALIFGGVKRSDRKTKAKSLLEMVGLNHRSKHNPSELSGGETQRVAIARALANNPQIILADEPTGNLDSVTSFEIMQILKKLNKEQRHTIIMVTHDIENADLYSDRIIKLIDGKVESIVIKKSILSR
jgi:putative ABC transport system ATP-binding protein